MKMRSASVLLSLLASVVAIPVPFIVVESIPPESHVHSTKPAISSQNMAAALKSAKSALFVNNRPLSPLGATSPDTVLATPRPIATSYLMGLVFPGAGGKETDSNTVRSESTENLEQLVSAIDVERPVEYQEHAQIKFRSFGGIRVPCYYEQLRREHNEMVVISLVAVFLLVVIAIEFWDNGSDDVVEDVEAEAASAGAIRLEQDAPWQSEKQPLSIQADPMALSF